MTLQARRLLWFGLVLIGQIGVSMAMVTMNCVPLMFAYWLGLVAGFGFGRLP